MESQVQTIEMNPGVPQVIWLTSYMKQRVEKTLSGRNGPEPMQVSVQAGPGPHLYSIASPGQSQALERDLDNFEEDTPKCGAA